MIVLALPLADDYGISWDEGDNLDVGRQTLRAYLALTRPDAFESNFAVYGPFYYAVAVAAGWLASRLGGSWLGIDGSHFAYFLSFVVGVLAVYSLGRRLASPAAALAGAVLFASQPLLFGHAFINPKDIPFMGLFALTVALAAEAADRFRRQRAPGERPPVGQPSAGGPLRMSPTSPASEPSGGRPARWLAESPMAAALLTGVSLGLATATRIAAPLAGALATGLMLAAGRRKALLPAACLWAVAALVTYCAWPYLWGAPFQGLAESLRTMAAFSWDHLVLYQGELWAAPDLPRVYALVPLLLQLTLPALGLAIAGSAVASLRLIRHGGDRAPLIACVLCWQVIPFVTAIASRADLYDNARQLLFAFPATFLLAAMAADALIRAVRRPAPRAGLLALAVLPGIWAIARLHPYEYIYFNELVGGTRGAFRRYELDYWAISYREAIDEVNEVGPIGATVALPGPWEHNWTFAREDLVHWMSSEGWDTVDRPDLGIFPTRSNMDLYIWTDAPVIGSVEVGGATLAVIRQLRSPSPPDG